MVEHSNSDDPAMVNQFASPAKIDRGRIPPQDRLPVCGATKKNGEKCRALAVRGSKKCYVHGGMTLRGAASGKYKQGRYSKYLPSCLKNSYESQLNDADLLSMRDELALLKARVTELASRLSTGETKTLWQDLMGAYNGINASMQRGEAEAAMHGLRVLGELIKKGGVNEETWQEIQKTLDGATKVSQAEWKRQVDMRQLVSVDKAVAMVVSLASSVQRHVTDQKALRSIQNDIAMVLNVVGATEASSGFELSNGTSGLTECASENAMVALES